MAEQADGRPERGTTRIGVVPAVGDPAARRPQERREDRHHRGLAGPVRTEHAENGARSGSEGNVREGATAAEVTRDILDRHKVEVYGNLTVNLNLSPNLNVWFTLLRSRFSVRVQIRGSGRLKPAPTYHVWGRFRPE